MEGVALLSSSIPYGIEMQVLRTMPTGLFSLITCLSPVVAALTAWAVRGQRRAEDSTPAAFGQIRVKDAE